MPKNTIFFKEFILEKAFELFKEKGLDIITARNVAKVLNCSPAPIYKSIGSMEILKENLIDKAKKLFMEYITVKRTGTIFLDIGMGVCIFAREEKELFKNIFLKKNIGRSLMDEFLELIHTEIKKDKRFLPLSEEERIDLFINCWIFANGLSTLIATEFIKNPTDEYIKEKLISNPAKLLYEYVEEKSKK